MRLAKWSQMNGHCLTIAYFDRVLTLDLQHHWRSNQLKGLADEFADCHAQHLSTDPMWNRDFFAITRDGNHRDGDRREYRAVRGK